MLSPEDDDPGEGDPEELFPAAAPVETCTPLLPGGPDPPKLPAGPDPELPELDVVAGWEAEAEADEGIDEAENERVDVEADPGAVLAAVTTLPVAVGESPVYAYTGDKRAGVTGSTSMFARVPSGWTGLFPGSLERVPVATKNVWSSLLAFPIDKYTRTLFVNSLRDTARLALIHIENSLVHTACRVTVGVYRKRQRLNKM